MRLLHLRPQRGDERCYFCRGTSLSARVSATSARSLCRDGLDQRASGNAHFTCRAVLDLETARECGACIQIHRAAVTACPFGGRSLSAFDPVEHVCSYRPIKAPTPP